VYDMNLFMFSIVNRLELLGMSFKRSVEFCFTFRVSNENKFFQNALFCGIQK
jgi:hypothetical protein